MDSSCSDLEFFDLTNASDEEIKEIRSILSDSGSNGCVELPWEVPVSLTATVVEENEQGPCEKVSDLTPPSVTSDSLEGVVGPALLYAPPQQPVPTALPAAPSQLNIQASEVPAAVEALVPQMPPISASSAVGPHYPAPYLVPRTLPYLRAYPPVGVPLFTCSLPGELTHAPSPYAPFLPLATPMPAVAQPRLDKPVVDKENNDLRPKNKMSSDRQYYNHHRNRKKNLSSGSYYASPPDFVQGMDAYQDTSTHEDQTLAAANVAVDRLSAVPSSLPVVPVPVPPSNFSVTSGALPMPSYPPGLHPIHYSQMSGPQAPTTPLYYVPVFNPHYSGYIPSAASSHMMLPMSNITITANSFQHGAESVCSVASEAEDISKSNDSLAASVESNDKSESNSLPPKADEVAASHHHNNTDEVSNKAEAETSEVMTNDKVDCVTDSHSSVGSDGLAESIEAHTSPKLNACCDEMEPEKNMPEKVYNDSSRCWADLFKGQCPEVNGLDRRPSDRSPTTNDSSSSSLIKEMTNGKLYSVPNSDNVL